MNRSLAKPLGADWLIVLFGAWVVASPFALGFTRNLPVRWDNVAVGAAVVVLAFAAGSMPAVRGLMVLLGGWLLVSPFYFGYSKAIVPWNNVIMGILIISTTVHAESTRSTHAERLKTAG
jgi:hypothetical protein